MTQVDDIENTLVTDFGHEILETTDSQSVTWYLLMLPKACRASHLSIGEDDVGLVAAGVGHHVRGDICEVHDSD